MRTLILTASFLAAAAASASAISPGSFGRPLPLTIGDPAGASAAAPLRVASPPSPAPVAPPPDGVPVPNLSLTNAMLAAPGMLVRVVGYVVDGYLCPPCPPGAQCKPCMGPTQVSLKEIVGEAPVPLSLPPTPTLVVAVPDPAAFARGTLYRFEVTTANERVDGVNARLVRFQRADEAPWPDASTERPGVVPGR